MPSLFNPLERNAFGFYKGTNGEADETKAAIQPRAKPLIGIPQNFLDNFTSRFQGATGGYGAATPLVQFLSGQGPLSITQNDSEDKPLSRFSVGPGGVFNLQNLQSGFNFTGDVRGKAIGMDVPVNIGGNKGTVGVQGSWGNFNEQGSPYIKANFAFGGNKQPIISSPEQAVTAALGPEQQIETRPELSAREQADQFINAFRSSGGRDPNSPSSWR